MLIAYRKEMESLFNTSKSNKHLWEQISRKMKEHGYDRSATMCTDKWRNLLKEYKKAKAHDKGTSKVAFYKDLEEILGERAKSIPYRSPAKPGMLHLSTKGKYRQSEDERNSYMYHTFDAHFTQSSSSRRFQDYNTETDGSANQDCNVHYSIIEFLLRLFWFCQNRHTTITFNMLSTIS